MGSMSLFGRRRTTGMVAVGATLALLVAGCGGLSGSGPTAQGGSLVQQANLQGKSYTVGGKDFDEQLVLCEVAVAALE
ncbi:MAG: hypothetical protein ACRDSH_23540, partial [Pseudonocardiaceae bacterium]